MSWAWVVPAVIWLAYGFVELRLRFWQWRLRRAEAERVVLEAEGFLLDARIAELRRLLDEADE